jgi:predicted GIY-YIG superfamily endonuclease
MAKRDTTTYELERDGKVEHRGITKYPDEREDQHQRQFPKSRLVPVGAKKTRTEALRWERRQTKTVTPRRKQRLTGRA